MVGCSLYMDLLDGNGEFEVNLISVDPFTEQHIDSMPTVRKEWGEVKIKNEPFKYLSNPVKRYSLYDVLMDKTPLDEIRFRFVSEQENIQGYCSLTDYKVNEDDGVIEAKITIFDQYTPIMENRETDVELFKESNIIRNGNFESWVDEVPVGWTKSSEYLDLIHKYKDGIHAVGLFDNRPVEGSYPMDYMEQSNENILKGRAVKLSFLWVFAGENDHLYDLPVDIFLYEPSNPSVHYRINQDFKWSGPMASTAVTDPVVYRKKAVQIPEADAKFNTFRKVLPPTPVGGVIVFRIYPYINDGLMGVLRLPIVANVELSVPSIELKTIKIPIESQLLKTYEQGADVIDWDTKTQLDKNYFFKYGNDSDTFNTFINMAGKPILTADMFPTSERNLKYADLESIFDATPLSQSYKFELSEMTIFKGEERGAFGARRNWYAIASFSREECWTTDKEISEGVFEPQSPSDEVGWEQALYYPVVNNKRLWVRKPFNGQYDEWEKGEINSAGYVRKYKGMFPYYESLTTKKIYPVSDSSSFEIETAIDLREFIRKVYTESHPDLRGKQVYSSFLWNDCENVSSEAYNPEICSKLNLTGVNAGSNYVTMTDSQRNTEPKNHLNNIVVVHTNDLSTDGSTDKEKSTLKVSFKKMMADFITQFGGQLFWFVDDNKDLFIEHIKYADRVNATLNMNDPRFAYIKEYREWEFDRSKMYSLEEYSCKNSGYLDFTTTKVEFDKIPSNKRGEDIKGSYATQLISTDVQFCRENADSLDNGIILIAYDVVGNENIARRGTGQKTQKEVMNGELSISSLVAKYGTYEGTWKTGKINGRGVRGTTNKDDVYNFSYTKRTKKGKEITFKGIMLSQFVYNDLGRGMCMAKTIDYEKQLTSVTLHYRYKDDWVPVYMGDGNIVIPILPTVITAEALTITDSSVIMGGNVVSDGGAEVTERGIYLHNQASGIETNGTKIIIGSGTGEFSNTITELENLTTYYFRAYAENEMGVALGEVKQFRTLGSGVLTVVTDSAIAQSVMSILVSSTVLTQGLSEVTQRGVCWIEQSANRLPLISDNYEADSVGGLGSFNILASDLETATYYKLRSYAINSEGIVYGNTKTVRTRTS